MADDPTEPGSAGPAEPSPPPPTGRGYRTRVPCPKQPCRDSPVEPSEEPWQALLLTEEQALVSLHTDHPGRLDQEQHAGAAPSWPTGWHLRTLLARAPGSQPAPSSPSQWAFASPCPELLGLAAEGAPPAAPATRAPLAGAPAGSGRRLQLERPAAPAAACTCPAREAASAIARALPSFVCVRSDGGKTKIGERRYANYKYQRCPWRAPPLSFYIVKP
mmetsp:Transcript_25344/g.81932  ORF Transcript_25344/g.81932 Transcript_25344/m.81932 type:complete len:218 (-) Transcript_25344:1493-2146(-)